MPSIRFNELTIKNLRPSEKQVTYWHDSLPGFGVMVSPGGTKTWTLMLGKARKRKTIGRYPIISLATATTEAKRAMAERTLGRLNSPAMPLDRVIRGFLADNDSWAPRTKESYSWLLGRLPKHFTVMKIGDITPLDIKEGVSKLPPSVKQHTIAVLKILFRQAVRDGLITVNPTAAITVKPSATRSRILSDEELKSIWKACADDVFSRNVKLLILTGCRKSEVQNLTVSRDTATLPAPHSKNGREHTFPLPSMALNLFDQPLTFNGWSKSKARLDKASGIKSWTLHDLRRTYATLHARMGTPPHIIERLLNHVSGEVSGVAAIYNRHHYLPAMRAAVDSYDSYLQNLFARA